MTEPGRGMHDARKSPLAAAKPITIKAQISCSELGSGVLTTWSVHSSVNTTFNFCANQ